MRRPSILLVFCSALAFIGAPLPAQRTLIVDSAMAPGADYADINIAYAASMPGDRLLVRPGTGVLYRLPSQIRHGIRLIGLGPTPIPVWQRCRVTDLPDDQLVVAHNLDFGTDLYGEARFSARNCRGLVLMSRFASSPTVRSSGGSAVDSDRVVMTRFDHQPLIGGIGVENSRAIIADSSLHPLLGVYLLGPGEGAPINVICGSEVWIVGCTLQGGDSWDHTIYGSQGPDSGLFAAGAGTRIYVGGRSRVTAGQFRFPVNTCPNSGRYIYAFRSRWSPPPPDPTALRLVYDPNTTWVGCWRNEGAEEIREFPTVHPGDAHPGQPQGIRVTAPSGSLVGLYASLVHAARPVELPFGDVWLDPGLLLELGYGAVDQNRDAYFSTRIPSWMQPGDAFVYQVLSLEPGGRVQLSPPGFSVVW